MRRVLLGATFLALLSGASYAADMYAAPEAPPEFSWNWTGLYVGGTGGYAFGDKGEFSLHDHPDYVVEHDLDGWVAGGFIGGNYQIGPMFVIGAELTGLWANIEGSQALDEHFDTHSSVDALVLGEGRIGIAWERALLYLTGGYAGGDVNGDVTYKQGVGNSFGNKTTIWEANEWGHGYTIGGGVDIKLTENWFVGVKYNHIELDDVKLSDNIEDWSVDVDSNIQIDQVVGRVGFTF